MGRKNKKESNKQVTKKDHPSKRSVGTKNEESKGQGGMKPKLAISERAKQLKRFARADKILLDHFSKTALPSTKMDLVEEYLTAAREELILTDDDEGNNDEEGDDDDDEDDNMEYVGVNYNQGKKDRNNDDDNNESGPPGIVA